MDTVERVAIYSRISEDGIGDEAGVSRQLEDGRGLAGARGAEVFGEYVDNDLTALTGKGRPAFDKLMADAQAREFTAIIVYHTSRLWRNRIERAQGIETLRHCGVSVISVKGPSLDLSTAAGRFGAGMLGEFDSMESEVKSERVTRAALQRAEQGRPNGSIPYGWRREYETTASGERGRPLRDVHHPDHAPVVAEVCRRLLAGQSLIGVTTWLNTSGIPAPGARFNVRRRERGLNNPDGQLWCKTSVKKLAIRATNCGKRLFHTGREDQRLMDAGVEPIITVDEWERLRAMHGPTGKAATRPGGRVHLLTWGVGECGKCGSVLRVGQLGSKGSRKALYACDRQGCVGRNEARVDAMISGLVADRLADADLRDVLVDNEAADAAMDRAEALRARLDAAGDDYSDGLLSRDQLVKITAKLRPQIAQADREAAVAAPTVPFELLKEVAGDQAADKFEALTVAQKRVLVEYLFEKIVIMPTRRGPGFDPKSIDVVWRKAVA